MSRIIHASALAALMFGAANDVGAGVPVEALVGVSCAIDTGSSTPVDLTGATPLTEYRSVSFTYHCNRIGSVYFEASSANGGVKNDTNSWTSNYGIFLSDSFPAGKPGQWTKAAAAHNNFQILSGSSGGILPSTSAFPVTTHLFVGLVEPLGFNGTYQDVLTIQISM